VPSVSSDLDLFVAAPAQNIEEKTLRWRSDQIFRQWPIKFVGGVEPEFWSRERFDLNRPAAHAAFACAEGHFGSCDVHPQEKLGPIDRFGSGSSANPACRRLMALLENLRCAQFNPARTTRPLGEAAGRMLGRKPFNCSKAPPARHHGIRATDHSRGAKRRACEIRREVLAPRHPQFRGLLPRSHALLKRGSDHDG